MQLKKKTRNEWTFTDLERSMQVCIKSSSLKTLNILEIRIYDASSLEMVDLPFGASSSKAEGKKGNIIDRSILKLRKPNDASFTNQG